MVQEMTCNINNFPAFLISLSSFFYWIPLSFFYSTPLNFNLFALVSELHSLLQEIPQHWSKSHNTGPSWENQCIPKTVSLPLRGNINISASNSTTCSLHLNPLIMFSHFNRFPSATFIYIGCMISTLQSSINALLAPIKLWILPLSSNICKSFLLW